MLRVWYMSRRSNKIYHMSKSAILRGYSTLDSKSEKKWDTAAPRYNKSLVWETGGGDD